MQTRLDRALFDLADAHPQWVDLLPPDLRRMLELRRSGSSLAEIGEQYDLTKAGVRHRLYGKGTGLKRGGGLLGYFRWLRSRSSPARRP